MNPYFYIGLGIGVALVVALIIFTAGLVIGSMREGGFE